MKLKILFFVMFIASQAHALSAQYQPYLNYETNWSSSNYNAFKSLASDASVPRQTFQGQVTAEQYSLVQNMRSKEFSASSLQDNQPARLMQFKTQTRITAARAGLMLNDAFWSEQNFGNLAQARFSLQNGVTVLSYDITIAEISCQFRQKIVNENHPEWNYYNAVANVVAADSMRTKRLKKIIVQACARFSHLMTHNIQLNFLFQDSNVNAQNTVYLVGYNQSFVKEASMSKLNLAFLWSGVEAGISNEIFSRFLILDRNVKQFLK
ncbi:MAG: hypothetical protein ACK5P5_14305 [Pseudobdellovibrionaceae bacterium]